ncbi:hypothetical protein GCM10018793_37590 [Streptomyces sulfonofaciens]|uniref:Uncharacterized protein n=1 Tax=Streptomyces sulfonofaciens TaxID=68272 RepID=A0A919GBT5_9ACTN|nr:hypothetical protein GCM10018793_37590 [Streptomyces sulfonofaciens]
MQEAAAQDRQVKKSPASSHPGSAEASRVAPAYMTCQWTAVQAPISSSGSRHRARLRRPVGKERRPGEAGAGTDSATVADAGAAADSGAVADAGAVAGPGSAGTVVAGAATASGGEDTGEPFLCRARLRQARRVGRMGTVSQGDAEMFPILCNGSVYENRRRTGDRLPGAVGPLRRRNGDRARAADPA